MSGFLFSKAGLFVLMNKTLFQSRYSTISELLRIYISHKLFLSEEYNLQNYPCILFLLLKRNKYVAAKARNRPFHEMANFLKN